jgi:hypothetical protein
LRGRFRHSGGERRPKAGLPVFGQLGPAHYLDADWPHLLI